MTDQHPLTDDKCYELWSGNLHENEKMRAAADWQLEQVIEWLKEHAAEYVYEDYYGPCFNDGGLLDDLEEAMRPTATTTQETPGTDRRDDVLSFARAVLSADHILARAAARKLRGDTTTQETP